MDTNTKTGMIVGAAVMLHAIGIESAETRKLLHDLGEHLRYERSAAEAELVGPVLVPQMIRGMVSAHKRAAALRVHIKALGALIQRVEFALTEGGA